MRRLREHAANVSKQVLEGAESAKSLVGSEPCGRCGSLALALSLTTCRACMRRVCGNCKARIEVSDAVVDARAGESSSRGKQTVCRVPCLATCVAANVSEFRDALSRSHLANVEAYFEDSRVECFPRPDSAEAPTGAGATARRLAPLAVQALRLTSYGSVATYAYRAFEAGGLAATLVSPQTRVVCDRVVPVLRRHFFKAQGTTLAGKLSTTREASELALQLYYFGCATALERLFSLPAPEVSEEEGGIDAALDAAAAAIGAAQWLYVARQLRAPHDGEDWSAWYASRVCRRAGWTLVACVGASRADAKCYVPSAPPTPFPAWCLALRKDKALLSVRGSATSTDWLINSDASRARTNGGYAHCGMLAAARAILDKCGARKVLETLFDAGFELEIVGHSMGAGVAAVLAALLDKPATCVCFAPPACVSPCLADALKDRVLSVVHRDDLVPRLSDSNCAALARDLVSDDANFKRRLAEDKALLAKHLKDLGKANAMMHDQNNTPLADESPSEAPEDDDKYLELESPPARDEERLVVPGRILYLRQKDASYAPVLGDHNSLNTHLNHIIVAPRAVDDHHIEAHLDALRAARWARGRTPARRTPPSFKRPATTNCACCGSDVTWTNISPGSDSARASATHHCRACGEVVCAFCAPAGDAVAGDGIAQTLKLQDRRISLPSMGYFSPVRVCYPCAFASYAL
ncbi:hypothetical protein CTAYLR_008154 [Chrysophaeum taylorii]|uniref:sn-1-specific diacylglycerol lipase n=1 Tax=Chrysophaeum taylorii TaxID=2483200 RepID=A0AAD7XL31_9STRA|nr:hypothetical protein CTAYLR_008154 [Chrysophaeum taylorii]